MTTHLPDETASDHPSSMIQVRGVRVHNLKNIDLDIPLNQLIAVCGVSGSGKTSLAFDTLYAEGQRRYLETLSPSARQYLNQLPKPDADQITQIPPAIALRQNSSQRHFTSRGLDSTAGIESGIQYYLRLLFTASGQIFCPDCEIPISPQSPETVLGFINTLPTGLRFQICYPVTPTEQSPSEIFQELKHQGLNRVILNHEEYQLSDDLTVLPSQFDTDEDEILVVLDRLSTRTLDASRILESLEFAFDESAGKVTLLVMEPLSNQETGVPFQIGQQQSFRFDFSADMSCPQCQREFVQPEPQLFNFFSPSGVCTNCGGSGLISTESSGVRSLETCPHCQGSRLNSSALAVRVNGSNIDQLGQLPIQQIDAWLEQFSKGLTATEAKPLAPVLREIRERLSLLNELGLGYLTLNRTRSTLSSGEIQRTALTSLLSSNLVNTLYVLDEPSTGLHAADSHRVISVLQKLRQLNNTLLIVEHDAAFIRAAEHIIELGPEAGKAGGEVVFSGPLAELITSNSSPTGRLLNAAENRALKSEPDQPTSEWITLTEATRNNLQNITVKFPLRQLCVVTGLSGSGKSSLIEQTLFPLLAAQLTGTETSQNDSCQSISGAEQIDEVILLDHSLTGQNPRSIPATYLNLFDEIRAIFAQTPDARLRNLSPGHFSFNSKSGGRCPVCKGTGKIDIDLQFLADLTIDCQECHGKRYQRELLEIKHRKLNIAEVLELTVDEAFPFFRGQPALQKKLKQLKDVGLGYLPLGQPLPTLSGGECQRLKLAAYLNTSSRNKTLFLMNEPTRGLHPLDIQYVLNCFHYLLTAGHSIILIEHNLDLIRAADHIIDLGPEAGEGGGRIVAIGTPAEIATHPTSYTAMALNQKFS